MAAAHKLRHMHHDGLGPEARRDGVPLCTTPTVAKARRSEKGAAGPVENLDLVRPLYDRFSARPELELTWIKAHAGNRWNEYADALATAYLRDVR